MRPKHLPHLRLRSYHHHRRRPLPPPPPNNPHPNHQSRRPYHPPATATLNTPHNFATSPLLAHTAAAALSSPSIPTSLRHTSPTTRLALHQTIAHTLDLALGRTPTTLVFGEDVAFGGVFRCTARLQAAHGADRVFNTPLTEQGIVGFAVGLAVQGWRPVAEVQFADYVYPAFDQIVNEAAKVRYRVGRLAERKEGADGGDGKPGMAAGGLTIRMPCGGVGHGALYHSQSPEALFTHIPGLRVVMPRSPLQAKGLLLAAIACPDPVLFLEPKILYRAAVEQVPTEAYEIPLSTAEVVRAGTDVTVVSYGAPLYTCHDAVVAAEARLGVRCELLDLRTLYPWDRPAVLESVRKTGRCVVVHESMVNAGVGAEVAATVQEAAFLRLEAPVQRVCGWSTHMGLAYERFNVPDVVRVYDAIKKVIEY